ncbi:MAG: transcription termination/antitermination protein NusA [Candidatus Fermentithermobacillus carboniphilus]|uniref:Transcription termination/antitermination protein NusA n=1 Tax=Candidatus Fermentithermobacillus carboniphilus TaxID=3085328 RepID=A0AAT9LD88_9FIRM|nr:MAG: transcription termination/antitermination protein NusA [Candidatus Fermentithermobacillus carboniphilus]
MNGEIIMALDQLERERGISKDDLVEALEAVLLSAYRKHFGTTENVRIQFDRETGNIKVLSRRQVVLTVKDPRKEISLDEARAKNPKYQVGDVIEEEIPAHGFGRIAAQTAKQVVVQRLRDKERGMIYEEFAEREGDVVTGQIVRVERGIVIMDLGRVEGYILPQEQVRGEKYQERDRMKAYVLEVKRTPKGPQIFLSRTHPGLLKRLFELEVPEIRDGVVEIRAIAREAGSRSKVAVKANLPEVDALGACVGPRGARVQVIVQELRGERIDIIEWDDDPRVFVANALSPARVLRVDVNQEDRVARVIVPENQLSLAIGRDGQNARLAAKLTGWKVDIKSERNA